MEYTNSMDLSMNASSGSSGSGDVPVEMHQLLSISQFIGLCLLTAVAYYTALLISANAVGEHSSGLQKPLQVLKKVSAGTVAALLSSVQRLRRGDVRDEEQEEDAGEAGEYDFLNDPIENQ